MSTNYSNIVAYLEDLLGDYTVKPQGNAAMLLQWVEQGALVRSLHIVVYNCRGRVGESD